MHKDAFLKKILITRSPWQSKAAVLLDNKLQDIYFDSDTRVDLERCFFKGKVAKVLPGLQTAFVDIGQPKAGFLHISEIDRELAAERFTAAQQDEEATSSSYTARSVKKVMNIETVFREGDDTLVQVIKEPLYEKGAKLTTCFTLPGKFLVLMPNIPHVWVSKKIERREERNRLREIVREVLPKGMGAIIRTTSEHRLARDIQRDVNLLVSIWNEIEAKFKTAESGACLFYDLPLCLRTVREHLNEEIDAVLIDNKEDFDMVYKFVANVTPEFTNKIVFYNQSEPLFERYAINAQIEDALNRKVHLKSGGSLIIETTEAMTVIDVNTGRFTGGKDGSLSETILKTNLEAAEEIVRQLRLRNIGGLIVIDFIDMLSAAHRQRLSSVLEKTLKERDRFQSVALKVSEFGLVQMTRKRSGRTLAQQLLRDCPSCKTIGFIPSLPTLSYQLLEECRLTILRDGLKPPYLLSFSPAVFEYLVKNEYRAILAFEKQVGGRIILESRDGFSDTETLVEHAD